MPPMNTVAGGIANQEEIKRILACADDEYDEILGVGPDVKEEERRKPERETGKPRGLIYIQGIVVLRKLRKPLRVSSIKPYSTSPH